MESDPDAAFKPLAAVDGQAAFDEPWQAQVLAIADTLAQNGLFSPAEWSAALGAELERARLAGAVDDQQTYYRCALEALEKLVAGHSEIDFEAMTATREDWERAYLSTPHGQPVVLEGD